MEIQEALDIYQKCDQIDTKVCANCPITKVCPFLMQVDIELKAKLVEEAMI